MLRSLSSTLCKCTSEQSSPSRYLSGNNPSDMSFKLVDQKNIKKVFSNYETILLDCDGVLWNNDHITPIEGIKESIEVLREQGKHLLFVTNNSMHGRQAYLSKFKKMVGFEAEEADVFGVSYATALYLRDVAEVQGRCYVVGGAGLAAELTAVGVPHFGSGPDPDPVSADPKVLLQHKFEADVGAVVVGFDEQFSYNKLYKAVSYLSTPGCLYVATNDAEMGAQLAPGRRQPFTGALVAAVSGASQRKPTVIGKPHCHLLTCIRTKYPNLDLTKTLMIGDSLKTDIGFAKQCGIDSMLVLTGVSQVTDVENCKQRQSPLIPNYVMKSLAEVAKYLK